MIDKLESLPKEHPTRKLLETLDKNTHELRWYWTEKFNEKHNWSTMLIPVETVTALLLKLVQERDDNKLLVIQAVTKLRAKEEQLEGKVLVDRKQLSDLLIQKRREWKTAYPLKTQQDFNYRILIDEIFDELEKELPPSSNESLNLALAFADVKKKKGSVKEGSNDELL